MNAKYSSERRAQQEISRTLVSRPAALLLSGFFLVLLATVPVAEMFRCHELRQVLLLRMQQLLFNLGLGNEQVYRGRGDWLFYRPDVEHLTGPGFLGAPSRGSDPLTALLDFHRQLAERGIRLMVVPVPVKPSLYAEKLSAGLTDGKALLRNSSTQELYRQLQRQGIEVVDLLPDLLQASRNLPQPLYLATDSHWTPAGMHLAARLLATRVRSAMDPQQAGRSYRRLEAEVENRGDTARLLPFGEDRHPVAPESITIASVVDGQGRPWQREAGSEILLLGDSFANIYSLQGMGWGAGAGLAEQLSFELGRPLDCIRRNGQGALATRQQLQIRVGQGGDPLAGKRLVIFQFAARELSFGDWRKVDLSSPSKPPPQPPEESPSGLEVEATVAALVPLPALTSTPYPDLVTSVHLVDVKARSGQRIEPEIVAFLWARRQGRAEVGSRLRVGERISLQLTPWSASEAAYGRFFRLEFDNPRLWDLPLYWAVE